MTRSIVLTDSIDADHPQHLQFRHGLEIRPPEARIHAFVHDIADAHLPRYLLAYF